MALKWIESFGLYGANAANVGAQVVKRWTGVTTVVGSMTRGSGSTGSGSSLILQGDSGSGNPCELRSWSLGTLTTTQIIGFSFKVSSVGTAIFGVRVASGAQFFIDMNVGTMRVMKGGTFTTLATVPGFTFSANTWYYLELKFTVSSSGSITIKVNGNQLYSGNLNLTGQTTAGQPGFDAIQFFSGSPPITLEIADIYFADTSGTYNNDFFGVLEVRSMVPNATGNYAQWTPNGAANNFDCVDEATPDGDTTYVQTATASNIDTYNFADPSILGSILGVQHVFYARNEVGNSNMAALTRSSATDYEATTFTVNTGTYSYYISVAEKHPDTSVWSSTSLSDAEFGFKKK